MNVKLSFSIEGIAPGSSAIITWQKNGSSVEVGRKVIDGTTVPFSGSFVAEGLLSSVYEFNFYESPDGSTLGTPIALPLLVDASVSSEESILIAHYRVGSGDQETDPDKPFWAAPNQDDQTLVDHRFAGATDESLTVHIEGLGLINPDRYEILPDGGITLTEDGLVFNTGTSVTLEWHTSKQVSAPAPTVAYPKRVIRNEANGGAFDSEWLGKINMGSFAGLTAETFLPPFADQADGFAIFSTEFQPSQRYWTLSFLSSQLWFQGKLRDHITLARNERVTISVENGVGYADNYVGQYDKVGQIIMGDRDYENTIRCTSSMWDVSFPEYPIGELRRLIEELPAYMKVSYATWDELSEQELYTRDNVTGLMVKYPYYPNRLKFAVNETSVKLPALVGFMPKFVKMADGTGRLSAGPGSVEVNKVLEHSHSVQAGAGGTQAKDLTAANGFAGRDTTGMLQTYQFLLGVTGGNKNIVDNYGQLPLIRL